MRNLGLYLMRSRMHASIAAFICALLPFLGLPTSWLAGIIIALVTLRMGAKHGLVILVWAVLPGIVVSALGYVNIALDVVLFRYLVVWVLALVLRRYQSWSTVLEIAALMGAACVLIIHGIKPDIKTWWEGVVQHLIQQVNQSNSHEFSKAMIQRMLQPMASIATGMATAFILLFDILILLIGRWWQSVLYYPGGLSHEFHRIRIGYLFAGALVICLLGVVAKLNVAIDVFPVLLMPFIVSGLSLVHAFAAGSKSKTPLLVGLYGLLVVFLPYVAILLTIVGFADSWCDFRGRWLLSRKDA